MTKGGKGRSESIEDYLEAIEELIAVEGHAHTKKIASLLGVTMPSVTVALRRLAALGYITYSTSRPVELTAAGKRIARQVLKRHKTLQDFFTKVVGASPDQASVMACRLEHVVDDGILARFAALLK